MNLIKIALLQMTGCGSDKDENLAKGELFCRRAKEMGADVALFPEMWSIGMTFFDSKQEGALQQWEALAVKEPNR